MSQQNHAPIDPRGPRFGATIINVLSLITLYLALDSSTAATAFVLLLVATASFAIGATLGNSRHPFGWLFRKLVRPLLKPASQLEDPRPPKFAQVVGLFVSVVGIALYLLQVPYAVAYAAGALVAATTLQAYFGYCLGCQIYVGLQRIGVIRQH